jgi:hypothetical protein
MIKDNYIIVHGSFGSPYVNWIPWLASKLTDKNVIVPQFPVGVGLQNYDNWSKVFKCYLDLGYINETTTIVGHSIAPIFIIHFLLNNNIKVKKLILVCGFNNYLGINEEYDSVNKSMYCDNIEEIHKLCDDIICFYSDNDPYVKYEAEKDFVSKVSTKSILIKNGGHLNSETGYNQFDEMLQYL